MEAPTTIQLTLTEREAEAVAELCRKMNLTPEQILRQALRTYQAVQAAQERGEPVVVGWQASKLGPDKDGYVRGSVRTAKELISTLSLLPSDLRDLPLHARHAENLGTEIRLSRGPGGTLVIKVG